MGESQRSLKRIGVVGAGVMGRGVAEVVARAGHDVVLVDLDLGTLHHAVAEIERRCRLRRMFGEGEPDAQQVLSKINPTTSITDLAACDLVVENATESWDVKRGIYRDLSDACGSQAVIVANTSAIPITRLASLVRNPGRVIGVHFMNPVPMKHAVELIPGVHTESGVIDLTREFLASIGKQPIEVRDSCGFVSNRVLMLTINEATFLVHDGVADAATVDEVFTSCFGHPMGPLATADLIGVDTILLSLEVLLEHYADPKFRPCPLLKSMTAAGHHGRKTGRGFFEYGKAQAVAS